MMNKTSIQGKRILVVPLNWGLGHVTRIIPIIKVCILSGAKVIIGGSPQHLWLLKQDFGNLEAVSIPFLKIRLSRRSTQSGGLIMQVPLFLINVLREHVALKRIIRNNKIDLVISDNCYGLWNRSLPCIFITHQLFIEVPQKVKMFSTLANGINKWFIRRYDACWVPDSEDDGGFAGKLSHIKIQSVKISYLGILSRFQNNAEKFLKSNSGNRKKLLIMISGPEKQRTVFEQIIRQQLPDLPINFSFDIIRGLPGHQEKLPPGWHNYEHSGCLKKMIIEADYIICRSGYSTIMDLIALKRTAFLVPTPGQSEQEYLAEYLQKKDYFLYGKQDTFNILSAIEQLDHLKVNLAPESSPNDALIDESLRSLII
jgi:UDP-N-acetylglucosamine:LPS N-acetylglucosamine transferase